MNDKKVEEELKKIWDNVPISHSDEEKEASWEAFQSKAFPSKKQNKCCGFSLVESANS